MCFNKEVEDLSASEDEAELAKEQKFEVELEMEIMKLQKEDLGH